jgi:hypothetical protein
MTLVDVLTIIRGRVEEQVKLAWRTAYYHRVKHLPRLDDELETLFPSADVSDDGRITNDRADRVWGTIRSGLRAWNAKFEREATGG